MTFRAVHVFELLELLLKDYRKLRLGNMGYITGSRGADNFVAGYSLTYMDELIDRLLTEERVYDIILLRLTKRSTWRARASIDLTQRYLRAAVQEFM
ncbi:hypothetical protein C8J57DRAFT_1317766 [Mycena rebaudengoi]|nr:hypothetical protein C8J57DRAFT_1317766 [Mycena rebaudengoi]